MNQSPNLVGYKCDVSRTVRGGAARIVGILFHSTTWVKGTEVQALRGTSVRSGVFVLADANLSTSNAPSLVLLVESSHVHASAC